MRHTHPAQRASVFFPFHGAGRRKLAAASAYRRPVLRSLTALVEAYSYSLTCRRCALEVGGAIAVCPRCGPIQATYARAGLHAAPAYACPDCAGALASSQVVKPVPQRCPDCYSSQLGWRNARSNRWDDQDKTEAQPERRWITGKLDTNYVGEVNSAGESPFGARRYHFTMRDSRLFDLQRAVPPAVVGSHGAEPLRFDTVEPVTVVHRDAEVGPERIYSMTLHDVRLHDWDHASSDGEESGTPGLVGRLWGTVYATLDEPVPPRVAATEAAPAVQNNQAIHHLDAANDGGGSRAEAAAPDSDQASHGAERAAADHGGGGGGAGDRARARAASAPAAKPMVRGHGWVDRLSGLWKRAQPPGFFIGVIWRWVWIASLILLLTCRMPAVLWALALFLLVRFFMRARFPAPMRRLPLPHRPWLIPFLLALLTVWTWAMLAADIAVCREPSWVWFLLLAACCLLPVILRLRVIAAIAGVVFLLALLFAYRGIPLQCAPVPQAAVQAAVAQVAPQQAAEVGPPDADADLVADESKSVPGGRISIDRALSDPAKYFNCGPVAAAGAQPYEIYLGESALFDTRQVRLGPMSDPHLRKVVRLLASRPDAHIVLTGHSDQTGTSLLNLRLSEQRAQNVADWLVDHGALRSDQIDVRGAGDRQPVIDDPDMFRLNRRVELRLDCQGTTGAPG